MSDAPSFVPSRTPENARADYEKACAQIGDHVYRRHALRLKITDLLAECASLNQEMARLSSQPMPPKETP